MIVVTAQGGGTIRESFAMAKAYTEARQQHGESQLLDELVGEKPKVDRTRSHSVDELRQHGLQQNPEFRHSRRRITARAQHGAAFIDRNRVRRRRAERWACGNRVAVVDQFLRNGHGLVRSQNDTVAQQLRNRHSLYHVLAIGAKGRPPRIDRKIDICRQNARVPVLQVSG